jgi:hypothetical protein
MSASSSRTAAAVRPLPGSVGFAPGIERRTDLVAQAARGPAQVGFEDLPDVHARRHAQRVQHEIDRRAVFQEGHVFLRQDAADDALVAVTAGHLVARLQLALHRHEDLDHLEHARSQFVAAFELFLAVLELLLDRLDRGVVLALGRFQLLLARIVGHGELPPFVAFHVGQQLLVDLHALLDALGRGRGHLAQQHVLQAVEGGAVEDRALVLAVLGEAFDFLVLDGAGTVVDLDAVTVEVRTSTIVPETPGGRRSEVSRTSLAFSPKIARSSFSSGVIGDRPWA